MSKKLKHQANHDALTGLANRRNLEYALERTDQGEFALCIIDLDRFKMVNDTSGHAAGDALLVQIGNLLKEAVRIDDTVVRLGGDEFAIMLRDCTAERALSIANKICEQVDKHVFHWEGTTHHIGCSIGVKSYVGDTTTGLDLLRDADAACYLAKRSGRNQVVLHDDSSVHLEQERSDQQWLQIVNEALLTSNFTLYAQDLLDLESNTRSAKEILIRLKDPSGSRLITPGLFMPAVERYGLHTKLDQWVVNHLLDNIDQFAGQRFWINLSGSSLSDVRFVQFLQAKLLEANLPRGTINFEITETAVIGNLDQATQFLRPLQEMGCLIALDDFGTGLSSFSYLKNLPVDIIKIDGTFVRDILQDPINHKFVQAIIEIAHTMGIATVAEFVENEDVLAEVRRLGADFAQGYAVARPAPLTPELKRLSAGHGTTQPDAAVNS